MIRNVFFVFKARLSVKEKFHILFIFIEILITVLILCAYSLMRSIIFHVRGPKTQENVSYVLDFYVSGDVLFPHFS
jgi:hypothetical protein